MRHHPRPKALHNDLLQIRLAIERAKLIKLEADIQKPAPHYTRYEDLPPPSPEDRARFKQRLIDQVNQLAAQSEREKRDWYLSMVDFAP